MKKLFILSLAAVFLLSTVSAFAAKTVTYKGTIQGAACTIYHQVCPQNGHDPSIAVERDFVLQLNNGKTYYFMPNLDRIVKAQYDGDSVRVTGTPGKNQIWVTRLELKGKNGYQTVWSQQQQEKKYPPTGR